MDAHFAPRKANPRKFPAALHKDDPRPIWGNITGEAEVFEFSVITPQTAQRQRHRCLQAYKRCARGRCLIVIGWEIKKLSALKNIGRICCHTEYSAHWKNGRTKRYPLHGCVVSGQFGRGMIYNGPQAYKGPFNISITLVLLPKKTTTYSAV